MIAVLIVDDHPIFRRGLSSLIAGTPGLEVAAEADDGIAALRLAEEISWDVALVDVSMPRLNGLEVLRRLKRRFADRPVLMLSQFPEDQFAARVLREGAAGYVAKSAPPEELLEAIRSAGASSDAFSRRVSPTARRTEEELLPHERLTPREYQVFTLVVCGRSPTDIAAELNMAPSTVSNHLAHIKDKLAVTTVGAIVAYAHRVGLAE